MYYLVTVGYQTERVDRSGNPVLTKVKYPVQAESVEEVASIVGNFNKDSMSGFEILSVVKLVIDSVIDKKNTPELYS